MSYKEIKLTNSQDVVLVDSKDFDHLNQFAWRKKKSDGSNQFHAVRDVVDGKNKLTVRMHRVIMDADTDQIVIHMNGNGLDNRNVNLALKRNSRWVARAIDSGFRGVRKANRAQGFVSEINFGGSELHIGNFQTAIEAARAYDSVARKLYGKDARVNFNYPE